MEYFLLNLNEKETNLFLGFNEVLEPIESTDFPFALTDVIEITYDQGDWHYDSAIMEKMKQYVREAYRRFKNNSENNSPLIISGVNKIVSLFEDTNDCKNLIGKIEGSYDSSKLTELGKKSNEIVSKYISDLREKIFNQFQESFGYKKAAFGLMDIWNLANEGRIDTLLVEENFHQPAKFEGNQPVFVNETKDSLLIEDLVDETIEKVFTQKGNVYFYEDGRLSKYGRIGAILRY
jgi:stalled ribosome rescue protein Dom34